MKKSVASIVAAWCLAIVLVAQVHETEAETCSPMELSPCLGAITGGTAPSSQCCDKLREQQPCFCGYIKQYPKLRPYINSPNVKNVQSACSIPTPRC